MFLQTFAGQGPYREVRADVTQDSPRRGERRRSDQRSAAAPVARGAARDEGPDAQEHALSWHFERGRRSHLRTGIQAAASGQEKHVRTGSDGSFFTCCAEALTECVLCCDSSVGICCYLD